MMPLHFVLWLFWLLFFGSFSYWLRLHFPLPLCRDVLYFKRSSAPAVTLSRRKPDWVRQEIIRLQAHLPDDGCRKIAHMFNRLFAERSITVGKTFVSDLLRTHRYEIAELRRLWKHRVPNPVPHNHTWGLDATGKSDVQGNMHPILGIVDHGSRLAVSLLPLRDLCTVTILRALLTAIETYGKPRFLRTDNAAQFHSRLFRFALALLGIRQRYSRPGCPWENGRIEKFFGTLKERLNRLTVIDFAGLDVALAEFGAWYNVLRPHNHLDGRTPYEAWHDIDPFRRSPREIRYVVGWDGLLTGYDIR